MSSGQPVVSPASLDRQPDLLEQRDQMGMMWLWWLLVIVGVVAVIAGLVLARRAGSGSGRGDTPGERALAPHVLDEQFARGEVTEEEYRTRRRELDER